jgi:hypothetical protein
MPTHRVLALANKVPPSPAWKLSNDQESTTDY